MKQRCESNKREKNLNDYEPCVFTLKSDKEEEDGCLIDLDVKRGSLFRVDPKKIGKREKHYKFSDFINNFIDND